MIPLFLKNKNPVIPTAFVEKILLSSTGYHLCILVKNQLIFWVYSLPLISMKCPCANLPNFFFSIIVLAIPSFCGVFIFLHFNINFTIGVSVSKKCWDFGWNSGESVDQFGKNWHFKNTEFCYLWLCHISPSIYLFSYLSL